ncbi:hypothetical protein FQA39_LY08967 [Lamprigera yunnana]|nr:hypothetical protein FQA39_LY08967 [Lamprigera yunnana]
MDLDDLIIMKKTKRIDTEEGQFYPESYFYYLYSYERIIFFSIYLIIYIVAFLGNICVVIITIKRKQRCIQKSCLISLSVSDFITATGTAVMHLSTFVEKLKIWKLGSFMCSFLPLLPVFGVICSSAALVVIAYDRYQNVVHALKTRWQPSPNQCIIGFAVLWICSAGISYPMYTYFDLIELRIVFYDNITMENFYETKHACLSFKKDEMMIYYITVMCILFLPLLFIYLWLYIKIAQLVWHHRKPVKNTDDLTVTSTSEPHSKIKNNKEKIRVEMKLRTFKIIVFLMVIFLLLRLPNLIYDTMKLSIVLDGHEAWVIKYVCAGLTLLSCALNPFLYTFLNNTILTMDRLKELLYDICCFCISTKEFEELQNEHPLKTKYFEKNTNESNTKSKTRGSVEVPENNQQINKY